MVSYEYGIKKKFKEAFPESLLVFDITHEGTGKVFLKHWIMNHETGKWQEANLFVLMNPIASDNPDIHVEIAIKYLKEAYMKMVDEASGKKGLWERYKELMRKIK